MMALRRNLMRSLIFITFLTALPLFSQSKDPDLMIKKLREGFSKVDDYEVDVKIKVDVDFIKVPDCHAKIFYKQPNKMHFESESFAMLPKEGMDFSPLTLLKGDHTAIYLKEDNIDGHQVSVIKVIPLGDRGDIVLNTLWVDQQENIIRRIETTTKMSGTYAIDLKYDSGKQDYYLPKSMIFTFNLDRMNIPKGISGETEPDKQSKIKDSGPTTGKVYVNYFNYKVNQGIPDHIFEKRKIKN